MPWRRSQRRTRQALRKLRQIRTRIVNAWLELDFIRERQQSEYRRLAREAMAAEIHELLLDSQDTLLSGQWSLYFHFFPGTVDERMRVVPFFVNADTSTHTWVSPFLEETSVIAAFGMARRNRRLAEEASRRAQ